MAVSKCDDSAGELIRADNLFYGYFKSAAFRPVFRDSVVHDHREGAAYEAVENRILHGRICGIHGLAVKTVVADCARCIRLDWFHGTCHIAGVDPGKTAGDDIILFLKGFFTYRTDISVVEEHR